MSGLLRDLALEELPHLSTTLGVGTAHIRLLMRSLCEARAVRLDGKALALVRRHVESVPEDAGIDMLSGLRLPWPRMWLEAEYEDGNGQGVLLEQEGRTITCGWFAFGKEGKATVVPPPLLFRVDQDTMQVEKSLTPVGEALRRNLGDGHFRELLANCQHEAMAMMAVTAVFTVLLEQRDLLRIPPAVPAPRALRRRMTREGVDLPVVSVSRIDLGVLGEADYQAHFEDLQEPEQCSEGEGSIRRARRSHWVRGHLFIARNRQLTYRRPHLRGTGVLLDSVTEVTCSTEPDHASDSAPEPNF